MSEREAILKLIATLKWFFRQNRYYTDGLVNYASFRDEVNEILAGLEDE